MKRIGSFLSQSPALNVKFEILYTQRECGLLCQQPELHTHPEPPVISHPCVSRPGKNKSSSQTQAAGGLQRPPERIIACVQPPDAVNRTKKVGRGSLTYTFGW